MPQPAAVLSMTMSDPFVTVTAYSADDDARAAKGALDSAGIAAVVDDAVERRLKVRVENVHAIRAGDVLNAQTAAAPSEIHEADEEERERACPACEATDVASSRRGRMFLLVAVLAIAVGVGISSIDLAFYAIAATAVFLLIRGRWRCAACGETFD